MNLIRTAFIVFMLTFLATSAYSQWEQTNWPEGNSYFALYTNQDTVFARIWDSNNGGRMFFTDDDGINWAQASSADSDIDILSIVMLDNEILAGTWNGFYKCTLDNIYWESFEPAGIPSDIPIWSIAMIDNTLFAGAMGAIYKSSVDDVNNWTEVSTGITSSARIKCIIANGNAIFAGSKKDGIFISTNNGASWTAVNSSLTDKHISHLVSMGTKMFAITLKEGVFVCDSNGANWVSNPNSITWQADKSGLNSINSLLPVNDLLFAGTDSNGVYLSNDRGLNWVQVNLGLPDNNARIWSMDISGDNIFAGTSEGVWKRNPEDMKGYTITASASEGGTISPEGEIDVFETAFVTFTITPDAKYRIDDVLVDGNSVGVVSTYTFSDISQDHTISAVFASAPYTITASAGHGGTISPSGTLAVSTDSSHTFTITPSIGCEILDVLVDGESVGAVSSYTFSSVNSDHTIIASFSSIAVYQINCGGNASLFFTADKYYSGGVTYSVANTINTAGVTSPAPQEVYQTERYYGTMTYTFPDLTSGASYMVRLHFAENLLGKTGFRIFNVKINGAEVLSNYDIYAEAGTKYKAVVKEFTTTANTSGQIVIEFTSVSFYAKIGGIEIIEE